MKSRKIVICGLPGAGKTTLAQALAPRLGAVHFNADDVRENLNKHLGFSAADRIEQARRMGWLCDQVVKSGGIAIADFVCPTAETRAAFGAGGDYTMIFVDRIDAGRFEDTNRIWERPDPGSISEIFYVEAQGTPEFWAEKIALELQPSFDPKKPTALFLGRYQPFHAGHRALVEHGIKTVGQACIAVRDTGGTDGKNPFDFEYVKDRIERSLRKHEGRFIVVRVPNITNIMYGRDVGYKIERIDLDEALQLVSATATRAKMQDAGPTKFGVRHYP